jgi:hypothetical protein
MVRRKKVNPKNKQEKREFDVIAVGEKKIILNETKSTPRIGYIDDFAEFLNKFYDYFPEYAEKKLIPIFASLYMDETIIKYLSAKGIYAMGMKDDTMDILNFKEIAKED